MGGSLKTLKMPILQNTLQLNRFLNNKILLHDKVKTEIHWDIPTLTIPKDPH
jgi:hypothetical protein